MDTSTGGGEGVVLARGFFLGFVVAQFISGWVSGPLVIIAVLVYVFAGQAARTLGQALLRRLPAMLAQKFVAQQQQPVEQHVDAFASPGADFFTPSKFV